MNFFDESPLVRAITSAWFMVPHHQNLWLQIASTKDEAYQRALAEEGIDPNRLKTAVTRAMIKATMDVGGEQATPGFKQNKRKTKAEQEAAERRARQRQAEAIEHTLEAESLGLGIDPVKHRKPVAHLVKGWARKVGDVLQPVVDEEGKEFPCTVDLVMEKLLTDPEGLDTDIPETIEIDGKEYVNEYAKMSWSEGNLRLIFACALKVDAGAVEDVEILGKPSAAGPNSTFVSTPSPTTPSEPAATES